MKNVGKHQNSSSRSEGMWLQLVHCAVHICVSPVSSDTSENQEIVRNWQVENLANLENNQQISEGIKLISELGKYRKILQYLY